MAHDAPHAALTGLLRARDAVARGPLRVAAGSLALASVVGAALLARVGTPRARLGAVGICVGLAVALALVALRASRRARRPEHVIDDVLGPLDRSLADAARRALSLERDTRRDASLGSPALAALHFTRLVRRANVSDVEEAAARRATVWAALGLTLAGGALVGVLLEPFRVIEGVDVLLARGGRAPLELTYLDGVLVTAAPPDYLHAPPERGRMVAGAAVYEGTVLTVRGKPLHPTRTLVLFDDEHEEPFRPDGAGGLVARWTTQRSTTLRVGARFGDVLVPQPESMFVQSIADRAPSVHLVGAPRTARLVDEPSVKLEYRVSDDHGLREVDLVLRSGLREERRVLSRPVDAPSDVGAYELKASDTFLRKTYAPVEVRIEARDNDPSSGSKWGRSEPVVLVPARVGEPEALRFRALVAARDRLTDLLAARTKRLGPGKADVALFALETKEQAEVLAGLEKTLSATYGGLAVRGSVTSLARGQAGKLGRALDEARREPTKDKLAALVTATEDALLALDAGLRMLSSRDARAVAKRLADVADELVAATDAARGAGVPVPAGAVARLEASLSVLREGGGELAKLGELGADLGEVVSIALRRVARTRASFDWWHTELVARDLAERLRRPEPSFSGGGAAETGGPPSAQPGDASEAAKGQAAAQQALEELIKEHGTELEEVARALDQAMKKEDLEALEREAKSHAEAIREAVKSLPKQTGETESAQSAAAAAREQAESMASALEAGRPADAVRSGKGALRSIDEAKKRGAEARGDFVEERSARDASGAQGALERELAWAERALEKLRQEASDRAKPKLEKSAKAEGGLEERAGKLRKQGDLADESNDRLRDAEEAMARARKALESGKGDEGLRAQREAQRLLEMARPDQDQDDRPERGSEEGDGKEMSKKAEIPDKNKWKGPERFRRRVLEGLKQSPDPVLREAIRRYAEGLLR